MRSKNDLQYLTDSIVLEALFKNEENYVVKNAFSLSSISLSDVAEKIKELVLSKYDKNRPIASVLNILTPGILSALGFGWLSMLVSAASIAFGVNFTGIFQSIIDKLKVIFKTRKKPSPKQVDAIVNEAVSSGFDTGVENELELTKLLTKSSSINDNINDALFIKKIALELDEDIIKKEAFVRKMLGKLSSIRGKFSNLFATILRWIFKVALTTIGVLGAGAAYSSITGKKFDSKQKGILPEKSEKEKINLPEAKSHSFKLNPDSSKLQQEHANDKYNIWLEPNRSGSIKDQIVQWAIDLYPELKDKKNNILQSSNFNTILKLFEEKNKPNANLIVIPDEFDSIKNIVDRFVGDIA